jgi:hypothetical protein
VPWFSKSRLSGPEKEAALELIRHLQLMLAYQQLTMEGTNDAFSLAAGTSTPTHEGLVRPLVLLGDPHAVVRYVIPALQTKLEILAAMEEKHRAFQRPTSKPMKTAYDDFTSLLATMRQRATFQYESHTAWTKNPSLEVRHTLLDSAEDSALNRSLRTLNGMIEKAGMRVNEEPWLEVVCQAFNSVRAYVGLPPLGGSDFRSRYFAGLMGQPARFFRD